MTFRGERWPCADYRSRKAVCRLCGGDPGNRRHRPSSSTLFISERTVWAGWTLAARSSSSARPTEAPLGSRSVLGALCESHVITDELGLSPFIWLERSWQFY